MTKPTEEAVIFKSHKQEKAKQAATSRSSQHEPIKEVKEQDDVKGRVRSINRIFSRISIVPSAKSGLPAQVSVDTKRHLTLTPRPRTANSLVSKVFSPESANGVVITSTRTMEDKNFDQSTTVFRLQSEEGVVITSTRKVDELREDAFAKSNSTLMTVSSHEDSNYCGAKNRSQLQNDALLLASAKQAVGPARAKDKDYARNTSTPNTFIVADDKKTSGTNKESDLIDEEDREASIFRRIGGAVDACSMRLCFERDEEQFIVIVPEGYFVDDDVSSLSGLSRF
ncbi:hypothetical protein QTG54_001172 [Skeletonema marinoi]|uniref:Uncharacterized protein n=1 Tax=Skeletonema marinoi TaxID=267567 RepID=A0AAD9DL00_9STRA|nr:hypothetical protein QTG54_001172 [Skeletonema marinoi]